MSKGNIFDYDRVRSPDMTEQMKRIDDAFAMGKAYSLVTTTTLVAADLGKSIRVSSAGNLTITFPAVGSDEDGGRLRLIKEGAGSLTNTAGSGDYINSYSTASGSDITSTQYAAIDYEYVHGLTRWVAVSSVGTWASA